MSTVANRDRALIFVAAIYLVSCTNAGSINVAATPLCLVLRNPSAYLNKEVRIAGEFISDMRERSRIIDESCPGAYLLPLEPTEPPQDHSLEEFLEAAHGDIRDLSVRKYRVDLTGRVSAPSRSSSAGDFVVLHVWHYERMR